MPLTPPDELLEYLNRYDESIQDLALTVREFVLAELKPPYENILNVYTVAMSYGPTAKVGSHVCIITTNANHVNLMFNAGAKLPDPHGLLEGSGIKMRHVKIRSEADLSHPGIREMLAEAWEHAGLGPNDRSRDGEVSTRISPTGTKNASPKTPRSRKR
jgi:hypothetical protein